jgi:hypothetical protein
MEGAPPPTTGGKRERVVKMKLDPIPPVVLAPENVKQAGQFRWLLVEELLAILRSNPEPFWPLETARRIHPRSKSTFSWEVV